jgi:serpin B
MILSNAMYFKSAWASKFFDGDTSEESFHNSDGTISQVPMMQQTAHFGYSKSDAGEIIKLPYVRPEIVFTVFLPHMPQENFVLSRKQANDLIGNLLFAEYDDTEVNFHLPKFEFEYSVSLRGVLESLGLHRIFGDEADLTSVSGEPEFQVDEIIHKTFVSIDEIGTQAAAVSLGTMVGAAPVDAPRPVEMKVDRPFWFFICDRVQEIILFAGFVNKL